MSMRTPRTSWRREMCGGSWDYNEPFESLADKLEAAPECMRMTSLRYLPRFLVWAIPNYYWDTDIVTVH